VEQRSSSELNNRSVDEDISPYFVECDGSLAFSRKSAIGQHPEPLYSICLRLNSDLPFLSSVLYWFYTGIA
jgi:hypothetical protein